jgi:hypothetical protein
MKKLIAIKVIVLVVAIALACTSCRTPRMCDTVRNHMVGYR